MAIKKIIEFVVKAKGATKGVAKLNKELETNVKLETEATQTSTNLDKSYRNANKGAGLLQKGIRGIGLSLKALGIGLVIALVAKLTQALSRNQKIMDAVDKVMLVITNTIQGVVNAIVDTYTSITEASGKFESLRKVIMGLITLALTPIRTQFYALQVAINAVILTIQRALNMLGIVSDEALRKTEERIAKATKGLIETADNAKNALTDIAQNTGKAFREMGDMVDEFTQKVKENVNSIEELSQIIMDLQTEIALEGERERGIIAKLKNDNEELKRIRDDQSLSYGERMKAAQDYRDNLGVVNDLLLTQAQRELELAQNQLKANEGNVELERAKIQAENRLRDVRLGVEKELTRASRRENALHRSRIKSMEELNELITGHSNEEIAEAERVYNETKKRIELTIGDEKTRNEFLLAAQKQYQDRLDEISQQEKDNILDISKLYMNELDKKKVEEEQAYNENKARIINEVSDVVERNKLLESEQVRHEQAMAVIELDAQTRIKEILRDVFGDEVDETIEEKLEREKNEALAELELLNATEYEKMQLINSYEEKLASEQKRRAEEKRLQDEMTTRNQITLGLGALNALSNALNEQSSLSKGIAIAETTWNTANAIMTAMKDTEMPWFSRIANSITAAAMGTTQLKNIKSTNPNSGGSTNTPNSVPPVFNIVGDARQQALDEVEADREQRPVQAYVVAGEVTSAQELERNRIRNARFL